METNSPIKILDVIYQELSSETLCYIIVDREPDYIYERKDGWLIAEDSGFFDFFKHDTPSGRFYAFDGREFDIQLMDGIIEHAYGQWWHGVPEDYNGLLYHIGYGISDKLSDCNVFRSCSIDQYLLNDWLLNNNPSNNYHKYDKRHANFSKHIIERVTV